MRLVLAAALIAMTVSACGTKTPTAPTDTVPFSTTNLRVGTGAEAVTGRTIAVEYTGWLYSASAADNKGTQFDSSLNPGRDPLVLIAGGSDTIPGFSQGVLGMRVGGLRRVVIPPSLGYGAQANGQIPGNSTMVFEIELLAIR